MTRSAALGLDLGTSGLKAVLVSDEGELLGRATAEYEVEAPHPGWAETHPAAWEAAADRAVADLRVQAPDIEIAAVGIDGQMHGVVLVDESGEATRPAVLWPDARAATELPRWRELPEAWQLRLANPLTPGMYGPVLGWLSEHEPEVVARSSRAVLPKDWLRSRLASESLVTDPSDASASLLWDVASGNWDTEVAQAVGIDRRLLPEIAPSDSSAGVASGALGIHGVPVSVGCADVAATLLGTGAPSGRYLLTIGTGAQTVLPGVAASGAEPINHHTYRTAGAVQDEPVHYAMAAVMNAGLALTQVVRLLGAEWSELYRSYDVTRDLPTFLPYFAGERLPTPIAAGAGGWSDLGLHTERADLLAAALEGVAFAIRRAVAPLPPAHDETVDLAGGGARTDVLAQLVADVLGRPLRRVEHADATARGAALLGWRAAGHEVAPPASVGEDDVIEPRAAEALEERYARFVSRVAL